jgi:hypothetical protein
MSLANSARERPRTCVSMAQERGLSSNPTTTTGTSPGPRTTSTVASVGLAVPQFVGGDWKSGAGEQLYAPAPRPAEPIPPCGLRARTLSGSRVLEPAQTRSTTSHWEAAHRYPGFNRGSESQGLRVGKRGFRCLAGPNAPGPEGGVPAAPPQRVAAVRARSVACTVAQSGQNVPSRCSREAKVRRLRNNHILLVVGVCQMHVKSQKQN